MVSLVSAPLIPFVSEVMYRNLTGRESVHLESWPEPDEGRIEPSLLERMATVREVVAMGLSLRGAANIKVRQPLRQILVRTPSPLNQEDLELIRDEVNVKEVVLLENTDAYARPMGAVDQRAIGPRFRRDTPQIAAAARAGQFEVLADGRVRVAGNDAWILAPEELSVHYEAREGYAATAARDTVAVLDLEIDQALRQEGLVRDIVRHVQTLRKEADYRLDERITVGLFGLDGETRAAVEAYQGYLCGETLCPRLVFEDDGGAWDRQAQVKVGDAELNVSVRR